MMIRPITLAAGTMVLAGAGTVAAQTITYSYDPLGRLVQVQRTGAPQGTEVAQYSYDQADNRTRVVTTSTNSPAAPPSTPIPLYSDPYSFEAPSLGASYAYRPPVDYITFAGNSGLAGNGGAFGFTPAPHGTQVAFIQSVPNLGATITLRFGGLSTGQNYRVRFRLAQRPGYGVNPVTVHYNGAPLQNSAASWSSSFTPSSVNFEEFVTYWFQAATTNVSIDFRAVSGPADAASGLDYVYLQEG